MSRIYKSFSTTSPNANENGNLYDMDVVVDDIHNLLSIKKDEMPMSDIGFIGHSYIYQPSLTPAEQQLIIDDALEQLSMDPRLNSISIDMEELSNGYYLIINATVVPQNQEVNLSVNLNDI